MDDRLEQRLSLWMSSRGGEVPGKLGLQIPPRGDRLWGEALVPCHGTFPQYRGEQFALDSTPDVLVVEHRSSQYDCQGLSCHYRSPKMVASQYRLGMGYP